MTAPVEPSDAVADLARRIVDTLGAINLRLDAIAADVATVRAIAADVATVRAIAADVALLRSMADAERQADGRPSFPQPAGWAR